MKNVLKSCLRIFGAVLGIIFFAGIVWAGIHRDSWIYDINFYIVSCIALSVIYLVLIFNTFRPQKWIKWIGIFILSLVSISLFFILFRLILWLRLRNNYNIDIDENSLYIVYLLSVVLSIYGVIVIREHKIENIVSKKKIKTALIIILPFIVMGIRAGLTKAGIILNWLDVELLYPRDDSDVMGGCYCDFNNEEICVCAGKPIIYLYPTTEAQINVKLGTPEIVSHTYPKYNSEKGWNVIAQPSGDLKDIDTGRKLYALYREGKISNPKDFDEGFIVAGKDIIPFLEEKLAILGLNEREAEEFIVYWLPQMEDNAYNLIRFETIEEQNQNMPLNITPVPDTVIRVMMDWKAIEEPIEIPQQQLVTPERNGFTVVEWGGSPRN